jgi:hypothetical protein
MHNPGAIRVFQGVEFIYAFKNAIQEMENCNLTNNYIAKFHFQ